MGGHSEGHGSGGHGHGEGHGHTFRVPDWRQYKIDGIKHLEWTRDKLAEKGLRDPWLRNEVWRYQHWPGYTKSATTTLFRGKAFIFAAAAVVITIAADQLLGISKSKHHGSSPHGDEHGGGGHH